jgi:hypothetical protein
MPLETPLAPVQPAGRSIAREANTNQPTVSHFFTRSATVRQRPDEGQGKMADFFNRFKDLGTSLQVIFPKEKALKNKQIQG